MEVAGVTDWDGLLADVAVYASVCGIAAEGDDGYV